MSNTLTLADRIKFYLSQSAGIYTKNFLSNNWRTESEFYLELRQTVFAFGNTEGGHILVRKTDKIEGLTPSLITQEIMNACAVESNFFSVEEIAYDEQSYFYIHVIKSPIPLVDKNGCYFKRNGPINQEVKYNLGSASLKENEIRSIEYEREVVSIATIDDLDEVLIQSIINNSQSIQIKEVKKFLQHLYLIEPKGENEYFITRAALLLFARNPKKWHPNIEVRFTQFKTSELPTGENYQRVKDETEEGCILSLLKTSWERLRPLMSETTFISRDKLFKTQILYPEDACYEALLNAIAHRDYLIQGRCIEIRIFEDKLEVISPGGLLSTIDIQDLISCKGVHESRNPLIARTLREIGYMRELGEGIKRIYETLKQNDLQNPELESTNSSFRVTLFHKYVYSNDEKKYLQNFSEIELSKAEKDIIRLGLNNRPLSRSDIMNAANLKNSDDFQKVITPLQKKGLIKTLYGQAAARSMAVKQNIEFKDLPRFLVLLPGQEDKYDSVKNASILRNNPTCIIVKFIPNELEESLIDEKMKEFNILYKKIKRQEYEDGYSVSYDLGNSDSVRLVIENKTAITSLNENIKLFPTFLNTQNPQPHASVNKREDTSSQDVKTSQRMYIPYGFTVPNEFNNDSIVVKNIPTNVDYNDILNFFSQFGRVKDLTINKNDRQNVFVKFDSERPAWYLIYKSGIIHFGRNKLLINEKVDKITPDK